MSNLVLVGVVVLKSKGLYKLTYDDVDQSFYRLQNSFVTHLCLVSQHS